jgi:cytochrome subunit of sulfide dehydrogenase
MHKTRNPLVVVLALSLGLTTACRDSDENAQMRRPSTSPTAPQVISVAAVDSGRALAANCFQCHGTDGNASELKIAGESASEIIDELNEMRAEHPGRNIMNVHALAYTPAEITLIANYFSQQGH